MENRKNVLSDDKAHLVWSLAKEILGEQRLTFEVVGLTFEENFEAHKASISAKVVELEKGATTQQEVQGQGVGLVDAFFDAMIAHYLPRYLSLDSISIVDFTVNAHIDRASSRRSDAMVTALLRVKNAQDFEYGFQCTTSSISHSSVSVVEEAIGFFINAEQAYTALYIALKDAEERNRHDLIEKYQNYMATIVEATSYQKLVEKFREQEK